MASEEQQAKAEVIRDAAAKGNLGEIERMVSENLEDVIWWINEGSSRGNTALQLAAMWGHVDCCQALLAAGADKDKQSNVRPPANPAPLSFAAREPPPFASPSAVASERPPAHTVARRALAGRAHAADVRRDQGWPRHRRARADQARRGRQLERQRAPPVPANRPHRLASQLLSRRPLFFSAL